MKNTVLATYERESTLWKNANAFYKAQDWTKMECIFSDRSDMRVAGMVVTGSDGKDYTDVFTADKYVVRLSSKKRSRDWEFADKDSANKFFLSVLNHKVLRGWKRVSTGNK